MATWTAAYINDLPDSAFLHIEKGGEKDEQGRTTPRSLRHFPYQDAAGSIDLPHLRNAMARIPQSNLPAAVRDRVQKRAQALLEKQNTKPAKGSPGPIEFLAPLVIEAAADEKTPPRFSGDLYTGGPLRVRRYPLPIVIDLAGLTGTEKPRPIFREHDESRVVAHMDRYENDGRKLAVGGVLSAAGQDAQEVLTMARNGFPWQMSIEALPDGNAILHVPEKQTVRVNGQIFTGPLLVARRSKLIGAAVTARGADDNTNFSIAAAAALYPHLEAVSMDFEKYVEALGLTVTELTEKQTAALNARYDAEAAAAIKARSEADSDDDDKDDDLPRPPELDTAAIVVAHATHEAAIEGQLAEYESKAPAADLAKIRAEGLKAALGIKTKALKEKWLAARCEAEYILADAKVHAELIRAERPKAPAIHAGSRDLAAPVIEAAIRLGSSESQAVIEKAYKPEVLEHAERFRGLGYRGLIAACCALDGRDAPPPWCGEADLIRAAFSTATLPNLLSNLANKVLLDAYQAVPSAARQIARKLTANDFKTHTGIRLTGDAMMKVIGPAGQLAHGTLGDQAFTYSVATYGRIFGITRQNFRNDDVSGLTDIVRMLGRGAALAVEHAFWTLVLANTGTFFGSGNANYISGATTVLGSEGLRQALKAFRDQVDPDGYPIVLTPKLLVIPTALEETAWELFKSTNIMISGATDTVRATANIFQGLFQPVVSPYLSNSAYSGYSAVAWYLFGDPADVAAFGIAYLDGQENPTVEQVDAPADVLGVAWRGYLDFGVCQLDPRGALKSKGAA